VGLGTKQGTTIAVCCSAAITCVLLFLNKYLFGIFTETTELIDLAGRMMRLMAVGYLGVAITQSLGGVMRGAGDTVSPMWISIISTVFLRVPIAYIMAHFTASEAWPQGHPFSLSASLLISWVLGAVMSCVVFKLGKWKKTMMAFHEP
jgi:Na+-driven multidrug efflux pump